MARRGENIHKRKDGRWEARILIGYKGKTAKYKSLYAHSYASVKAKREEALATVHMEQISEAKKLTSFSLLAQEWLCAIEKKVKESTFARYHRAVYVYLLPDIGNEPLTKVSTEDIQTFITGLSQNGGKRGHGLSPKTVADLFSVLKLILNYGKRQGYACPDLTGVECPKVIRPKIKTVCDTERNALETILWKKNDPFSLGLLFTLYTGVRIGELCGLRWEDFDFAGGTVKIRRIVERIADVTPAPKKKTCLLIGTPKTENGVREIPLPKILLSRLQTEKKSGQCYLLTGTTKPAEPHTVYVRYRRFLKRNGLSDYTFHALRHTFATRCVEAGFDVKSLSEILGHSDVTTTLRCYVHPSMKRKQEQMEMLVPAFLRGQKSGKREVDYIKEEIVRAI